MNEIERTKLKELESALRSHCQTLSDFPEICVDVQLHIGNKLRYFNELTFWKQDTEILEALNDLNTLVELSAAIGQKFTEIIKRKTIEGNELLTKIAGY